MILKISDVKTYGLNRQQMGGKAYCLAKLAIAGVRIPATYFIPSETYKQFSAETGICDRIMVELSRKDFSDMRWEEIWDAALRIRNLFIKTAFPEGLKKILLQYLPREFESHPVVVRSSGLLEDGLNASFAGLHESYVNVVGSESILDHVKLVWASLWSDRALMYRNELGLDAHSSSMAVIIQELIEGQKSGVIFTKSPDDHPHSIIECVYGLNQGLVDGSIFPDRWILTRSTGDLVEFQDAERSECLVSDTHGGIKRLQLDREKILNPPLNSYEIPKVYELGTFCESLFGHPQDVEWTFLNEDLIALQSRPISSLQEDSGDQRVWYRSLVRSFDNLRTLRQKISSRLIPEMIETADKLSQQTLEDLSDSELGDEIQRRIEAVEEWTGVYWKYFIPFAHGIRLFGQFYNDSVRPDDPYEFMSLLVQTNMLSLERNRTLKQMAMELGSRPPTSAMTAVGSRDNHQPWDEWLSEYLKGDQISKEFFDFLKQYERVDLKTNENFQKPVEHLIEDFLGKFEGEAKARATEILDLARYSYRLRDDDNIYLGRIESQLAAAVNYGVERLSAQGYKQSKNIKSNQVAQALKDPFYRPIDELTVTTQKPDLFRSKVRQLRGQPAGPGFASGMARVIHDNSDLLKFKAGEIMVCDAIDPNMTFVVPLCSAIVERRGGMLIHGAIIAREYGLPCVTGVPEASSLINTGDRISVDGYLGLVTIG